jgi:hypothetical protein
MLEWNRENLQFLGAEEAGDEEVLRTAADEKLAMRPISL